MRAEVAAIRAGDTTPAWHVRRRRDQQALKSGAAGVVVQVVSQGFRLVVIPLSIKMLGVEHYGLWLVVGSLVAWGGVMDLGLSPGLVNVVARAQGRGDREGMRRIISTALAAYGLLAMAVVAVAVGLSRWRGLAGLLGARTPELAESGRMLVLVCGLIFAASISTRVVSATASALQEGYLGSLWYLAGSVASLGLLFTLAAGGGGGLLSYALVVSIPPLLSQVGLAGHVFGRRHRDLRPGLRSCDGKSLRTLLGFAGPLTVYQMANIGVLYWANLLIANRLGGGMVPQYSVPYAAFGALVSAAWLIVSPYLSAYAAASAQGDWHWIRRRAIAALTVTVALLGGGGALLVLAGPKAIRLWTDGHIQPTTGLMAALACFCLVKAVSNANGILLTGLGLVRLAAGLYLAVATLYVASSWLLLPRLGLIAVPLAGAVAHLLDLGVSLPYALRRMRIAEACGRVLKYKGASDAELVPSQVI